MKKLAFYSLLIGVIYFFSTTLRLHETAAELFTNLMIFAAQSAALIYLSYTLRI